MSSQTRYTPRSQSIVFKASQRALAEAKQLVASATNVAEQRASTLEEQVDAPQDAKNQVTTETFQPTTSEFRFPNSVLPKFDCKDPAGFLLQMERFFVIINCPAQEKTRYLLAAVNHQHEIANKIYMQSIVPRRSWEDTRNFFLEITTTTAQANHDLVSCQMLNGDFDEYVENFMLLLRNSDDLHKDSKLTTATFVKIWEES